MLEIPTQAVARVRFIIMEIWTFYLTRYKFHHLSYSSNFFGDKNYNCTFPQRFDDKKKLLTDHDAVLQTISEKLAECQQWQAQHKVQKPLH